MSVCNAAPDWLAHFSPSQILSPGVQAGGRGALGVALGLSILCLAAWAALRLRRVHLRRTERLAKLEREVEQLRDESRRKSFFLNAVSHDLRTPLHGILLQASLAEVGSGVGDHDAVCRAVHDMKAGAKAAADMLDGLLEYARADAACDSVGAETVELGVVIGNVVAASTASAALKGLSLRSCVPVGLAVRTDRRRLERILTNLVTNAVKFTESGEVRVEVQRGSAGVRVHVIDTGIGIAPQHRERLFEEFFQVDNRERNRCRGFGLGLAIARKLARQMGGDIKVESALGHGSRFTLTLPCEVTSHAEAAPGLPPAAPPAIHPATATT